MRSKQQRNLIGIESRFSASVARYAFECSRLNSTVEPQIAVLMLRNAKLSDDTLKCLLFQINRNAHVRYSRKTGACVEKQF